MLCFIPTSTGRLRFILADILAFVARYHAIRLGGALFLANVGLASLQAGNFGPVQLVTNHVLANAGTFVGLAGRNAGGSRLG